MPDQPEPRRLPIRPGPAWRVAVDRDFVTGAVHVRAAAPYPDQSMEVLGGELTVTRHETGGPTRLAPEDEGGLMLPEPLPRALYDALAAHYGHAEPTRSLRADYEHLRARHDGVVDALVQLAARAQDATAMVAAMAGVRPRPGAATRAGREQRISDIPSRPDVPGMGSVSDVLRDARDQVFREDRG